MKVTIALLITLLLAGIAFGQVQVSAGAGAATPSSASTADVLQDMKAALAKDPTARLTAVKGYDAKDKAVYRDALVAEADTLQGAARVQYLVTIYRDFVGWGQDATNLKDRITAAIGTITDPAEKARAADSVLFHAGRLRTVALGLIDTPGLSPGAQRAADALGVLKGRHDARNLVASWNTSVVPKAAKLPAWYGPSKVDLKRILVLVPVADHKSYVSAVNAWLVRSRTADLTKTSADYQAFLKDGTGGTNLLAGVTLPADDEVGQAALAELERTDLSIDSRVDMLLVLNRNREAFVAAESQLNSGKGTPEANVYRVAKVIKALDGNWKRATDYVNLFQPRAEGESPITDPIPAVKQELGL